VTGPAVPMVPAFDHIFVVIMENHSPPDHRQRRTRAVHQLAGGKLRLAASYTAVAHPSLPNYLALTGGSTFGLTTDCTHCFQNAPPGG